MELSCEISTNFPPPSRFNYFVVCIVLVCTVFCRSTHNRKSEEGEPDVNVVYIPVGPGAKYRPIARGGDYAVTSTGATEPYGGYTGVAIIDLVDQVMNTAIYK